MRAAWRLAINSLSGRRNRAGLLAGAVALSAALITCVACAMASIHRAINEELAGTVGAADVRIRPAASLTLVPTQLLDEVRKWDGVRDARGRLSGNIAVSMRRPYLAAASTGFTRKDMQLQTTAQASMVDLDPPRNDGGPHLNPQPQLLAGRLPAADDEVAIDALLAYRLSHDYFISKKKQDCYFIASANGYPAAAIETPPPVPATELDAAAAKRINTMQRVHLNETIDVVKQSFPGLTLPALIQGAPTKLKVVGIAAQPPLGGRARAYLTRRSLAALTNQNGYSEISIAIQAQTPDQFVAAHKDRLPEGVLLQTTERVTSGLDKNMQSNQLGMILATVMAFLSASFIILTGLTTSIAERQRELAMIRCIGGTSGQLGAAQLIVGLVLGGIGAAIGVPLGIAFAAILAHVFSDQLPTGLVAPWWSAALAVGGSLLSGLIGATWPAWRISKLSPLEGLASRAAIPRPRGIQAVTLAGFLCLMYQAVIVGVPRDGQFIFWAYATSGLPIMFIGYFLLGVPTSLVVTKALSGAISKVLKLPPRLLSRTVQATPYRHGLTAGALMAGLALMVAIWIQGGAVLRDWIDKIKFPDAFVSGVLSEASQRTLDSMTDTVAKTAAITLHPVEVDAFGVRAIQKYKTMFIGFEPRSFVEMTKLTWVQGDPEHAVRRLEQGGAIIVAREFQIAQGLGVGDTFTCAQNGEKHTFEIVGVVASPGLEIASKFFNVGEDLTDQSIHAVFGSRDDLKRFFFGGQPAPIHLIQIVFTPRAIAEGDEAALERIRAAMIGSGSGFLDAGSGRQLKEQVHMFAGGAILVFSSIAMVAMLVACFGVANIIIAGIDARQFEFGILRAIGARPGLLTRLIIGEALIIAIAACILGTTMGIQGSWAGQRLNRMLLGLDMSIYPPPLPIAASWAIVILLTLAAAAPAILRLSKKRPRDLLSATKG